MSKKILLSVFTLFCFTQILNAQISKGSVLLGGGIGFSSNSSESGNNKSTQKSFYVNPAAGVAVKTSLIIGGDINYSNYINSPTANVKDKYNTYGAGIFLRKYFPAGGKFYLFGQARAGINRVDNKNEGMPDNSYKEKGWGINVGLAPGISFAVNKKLHIESGFNNILFTDYQHINREDITLAGIVKSKRNNFNAGTSLNNFSSSLYIGFRLLFSK